MLPCGRDAHKPPAQRSMSILLASQQRPSRHVLVARLSRKPPKPPTPPGVQERRRRRELLRAQRRSIHRHHPSCALPLLMARRSNSVPIARRADGQRRDAGRRTSVRLEPCPTDLRLQCRSSIHPFQRRARLSRFLLHVARLALRALHFAQRCAKIEMNPPQSGGATSDER